MFHIYLSQSLRNNCKSNMVIWKDSSNLLPKSAASRVLPNQTHWRPIYKTTRGPGALLRSVGRKKAEQVCRDENSQFFWEVWGASCHWHFDSAGLTMTLPPETSFLTELTFSLLSWKLLPFPAWPQVAVRIDLIYEKKAKTEVQRILFPKINTKLYFYLRISGRWRKLGDWRQKIESI